MDKDLSDSDCQTSQDNDNEQSLVDKIKKNVLTPFSKWFRKPDNTPTSSVRRRQDDSDDDDEEFHEFQPPTKRTKLPPTKETLSLNVSETLSPISSFSNMKKPMYKHFPEPIAGPSGYQTRKMLNSTSFASESNYKSVKTFSETTENVFKNPRILGSMSEISGNVNKESQSDSEESTSGYSSGRIGSKEVISQESSKQASPLENSPRKPRSLFQSSSSLLSDRSLSPNRNSSLSSRMPSFNPSTFGSSNFVDRTLSTKKILNSPFYNGNTIYGGASAYGKNSKRVPQDMRKVLRQSVSIKPVNRGIETGDLQLGKTARRILDTLEKYSSPVSDAKKIPVASKKFKSEGSLTRYIGANPYSIRESRSASNRELQVPSVTDLLKMKIDQQKTRLQDSTEAVRQIANKSRSVLNEESYQIPVQRENDRHTGKMKNRITSVRQRVHVDETVPEVNLNPVSLPIKELPKFDIIVPPPSQKPLAVSSASNIFGSQVKPSTPVSRPAEQSMITIKPVDSSRDVTKLKENVKTAIEDQMEFKFSAPLVLAEYLKPLKALNNFKFSEPLIKRRRSIHPELDHQEDKAVDSKKSKKNNGENVASGFDGTKGSSLLWDKFKSKEGTWECSVCMIRNQADKTKCAACETSRSSSKSSVNAAQRLFDASKGSANTPLMLADKFKAPLNTWECPTCMIRNKEDVEKCAACETKKPGAAAANAPSKDKVPSNTVPPTFAFGDKFKVPLDTWECPTCLIRNKSDVSKCVACETEKPGKATSKVTSSATPSSGSGFGTRFAPPSSTWECSVCMIRNKDELTKCAACENPRQGAKGPIAAASFGADFQKKNDEWECEACMVRNKSTTTKCICCESLKPGASLSSATSSTAEQAKVSSFNFGIDKNTATGFSFGIPPDSQSSQSTPKTNAVQAFGENREKVDGKKDPPTFTFGVPATTSSDTKATETKKDTPVITVSAPKTSEKDHGTSAPVFTAPKSTKPDGAGPSNAATPTFSFAVPKKTPDPSPSYPSFAFGSANKIADKAKEGGDGGGKREDPRKANPLLKPSEKLPEKAAVAASGFSFGLPKGAASPVSSTTSIRPSESSATDESPKKRSKPGGELPETPQMPMFTFKAPTTNGDINKSSPFSKSSVETKPAGGFSFNAPKSTAPTSAIVTPTFGSTIAKVDGSKSAPMFKFGASSSDPPKPTNGFNFASSAPSFWAKPPTTTSLGTKPFAFASPAPAAAAVPAPPASNPPPFGTPPTKAPMFQFGATPESKPQTSAPAFSFNAPSAENKSAPPPQYPFGAPPAKAPAFSFGQSSASAPSFNFASSNSKPVAATPFGTTPAAASFGAVPAPAAASFGAVPAAASFGAASVPAASSFGAGSTPNPFGAPITKPGNVFGAVPSQNSAPNGMFNFGSGTTTNQKAGFSFGASGGSSEPVGAAVPQGGFNFGSSAAAPAAPGGFNFSSPAAPSFDANAKPSFNFTGGTGITAFAAPPSQEGAMPQRKIKKAIRRTPR